MLSGVGLFVTPWAVARQGPSVCGISQARILHWIVAISFSRGFSWIRDQGFTSPALAGGFFTAELPGKS